MPSRTIYTGFIGTESNPLLFFSAGEASGEHYGAQILAEMKLRIPGVLAFGLGGQEMAQQGLDRVVRTEDVAIMGITEVIRHMPRIYGEYRKLVASIRSRRPQAAILIDFPDVNLRLAKELKKLGIPVIYFVSPQLWAWKRRRLRWVQERVDKMLVIFPFEERFYQARGVNAAFVGHPLATLPFPTSPREEYASRHNLNMELPWIALLPGSRRKEVRLNLPEMVRAAMLLQNNGACEFLLPVAHTVGYEFVRGILREAGCTLPVRLVDDAREAMYHARASVVASGTATVQAALMGNPFVVVYKVSGLTFRLAKRLVRYPAEVPAPLDEQGQLPIAMANLVAGRRIVPELLQNRFTAEQVHATLKPLLTEGPARARMIADLAEVRLALLGSEGLRPIPAVCDAIESLLHPNAPIVGRTAPVSV